MSVDLEFGKKVDIDVHIYDTTWNGVDLQFDASVDRGGDIRIEITSSYEDMLENIPEHAIIKYLQDKGAL